MLSLTCQHSFNNPQLERNNSACSYGEYGPKPHERHFLYCQRTENSHNSCVTICTNNLIHCKPFNKRHYRKQPVKQRQQARTEKVLSQSAVSPTGFVSVTLGHLNSTELVSLDPALRPGCSLCVQHTESLCRRIIHTG